MSARLKLVTGAGASVRVEEEIDGRVAVRVTYRHRGLAVSFVSEMLLRSGPVSVRVDDQARDGQARTDVYYFETRYPPRDG